MHPYTVIPVKMGVVDESKWCCGVIVNYPGNAGTPTADMTLFKILMISIISTEGARWVMVDIKDFYLCMPMKRFKYMRL